VAKFLEIERDTYRERYAAEIDRRAQINDRTDAQIQLFSLFVGLIVYFLLNIPTFTSVRSEICFGVSFVVLGFGTFTGLVLIAMAVLKDKTAYLPSPADTRKECVQMLAANVARDPVNGAADAQTKMVDRLDDSYLFAAQANVVANDKRDLLLRRSKYCVFIALGGFLLMALPYVDAMKHTTGAH